MTCPRFNEKTSSQESNAIWPIVPVCLMQELLNTPNRKVAKKTKLYIDTKATTNDQSFYKQQEKNITLNSIVLNDCKNSGVNNRQKGLLSASATTSNEIAREEGGLSDSKQQAYEKYISFVKIMQEEGISIAKAHMRAYNKLNKEDKIFIAKYLEEQTTKKQSYAIYKTQIFDAPGDKIGTHKIYDNYIVNSKSPVDKITNNKTSSFSPGVVTVITNKKITPTFITDEIKKIKNQIPATVFNRGRTINDIVFEVQFHVENRDLIKTKSALHALNAAKAMLKGGLWGIPKKYVYVKTLESIKREKQAKYEKQQEFNSINGFLKKQTAAFR